MDRSELDLRIGIPGAIFIQVDQRMDKLYKSQPMQVGPSLAQVLIGCAKGHKLTLKWAGEAISRVSAISQKQVTPAMLHSTFGPTAARAFRASMLAGLADKLVPIHVWVPRFTPSIRLGKK
jgi:hypothetical protein